MTRLILLLPFLMSCVADAPGEKIKREISTLLFSEVIDRGNKAMSEKPVTITSFVAARSAGGIHDFYSEGDYWWPNPADPDGAYIRRDGQTNPDNFTDHRHAMIRFSIVVGDLTSAYLLTRDKKYAECVINHIRAWFIDPETRMNPNLLYAQAIKGVTTGRGVGIIDTIHLLEVVRSLEILEKDGIISTGDMKACRSWFSGYLHWLTTHPYGIDEMNAQNNHATCWVMQAASFAKFTGNEEIASLCIEKYKQVLLPVQMDVDGSFPLELRRTKPYGYSIFNLDAMATICHILSDDKQNLWQFTTDDGRNLQKGVAWLFPYIRDKSTWPYEKDIMYWDEWPVASPALLFSVYETPNEDYFTVWKKLDHFPANDEVIRNLPVRHPLLWL